MSSVKRWSIGGLLLIALIALGAWWGSNKNSPSLEGFRGLINTQLPGMEAITWHERLRRYPATQIRTQSDIVFTIPPALLTSVYASGDYLLSGHGFVQTILHTNTDRKGSFTATFSGQIQALNNGNIQSDIIIDGTMQGVRTNDYTYLLLDDVQFSNPERDSETLHLRYLLIKRYTGRRIQFSNDQFDPVAYLHPGTIFNAVTVENSHTRVVPDQEGGWIYQLRTDKVGITGHTLQDKTTQLDLSFPTRQLSAEVTSTHVPHVYDISIQQHNSYQGKFEGILRTATPARKLEASIAGEATWPAGIRAEFSHHSHIQKASPIETPIGPKLFLERSQIVDTRKTEK